MEFFDDKLCKMGVKQPANLKNWDELNGDVILATCVPNMLIIKIIGMS